MTATKKTVDTTDVKPSDVLGVSDTAGMTQDTLTPATDMAASGAFIEREIVERIDVDHPAVDNNPRKGQPKIANQIDFNDGVRTDAEIVAEQLGMTADKAPAAKD